MRDVVMLYAATLVATAVSVVTFAAVMAAYGQGWGVVAMVLSILTCAWAVDRVAGW